MPHERMLDQDKKPTDRGILQALGKTAPLWNDLRAYLKSAYDIPPELDFGGKKYGWSIRYRRSGKTLVTLFPEQGSFTVLIVLGKKEVAKIGDGDESLSRNVQSCFDGATQLHDGRWLWIRPSRKGDVESIKVLLTAKRRPKAATHGNTTP
ncbi:MAG TPA: DUF3788 domain-containing protein [Acidobacteriota bacterium]|nr:DUF3788 domain-containing protein [Acidobacteriota bacterium]